MNNKNYSPSSGYSLYKQQEQVNIFYGETKELYTPVERSRGNIRISRQLEGKIKFVLGFIYFFSLIYFAIKLIA